MFTGLIEAVGKFVSLSKISSGEIRLTVSAPSIASDVSIGESIALNGCCLTVVNSNKSEITFELLRETIVLTNFKNLKKGSLINLERSLLVGGRLGGHFVQGHVDAVGDVVNYQKQKQNEDRRLEIQVGPKFLKYCAAKGSIAINGISLTIAEKNKNRIVCWVIPHTHRVTNLQSLAPGDHLNLEFDILAKYVENFAGSNR